MFFLCGLFCMLDLHQSLVQAQMIIYDIIWSNDIDDEMIMMLMIYCHLEHTFIPQLAHVHLLKQDHNDLKHMLVYLHIYFCRSTWSSWSSSWSWWWNLECKHGKDHKAEDGEGHHLQINYSIGLVILHEADGNTDNAYYDDDDGDDDDNENNDDDYYGDDDNEIESRGEDFHLCKLLDRVKEGIYDCLQACSKIAINLHIYDCLQACSKITIMWQARTILDGEVLPTGALKIE